jgi:hypothetical protein
MVLFPEEPDIGHAFFEEESLLPHFLNGTKR